MNDVDFERHRAVGVVDYFDETVHDGLFLPMTCPSCGTLLEITAGTAPRSWSRAVALKCTHCPWTGGLRVDLFTATPGFLRGTQELRDADREMLCGTDRGWKTHMRRDEMPCGPCGEAHSRSVSDAEIRRRAAAK